MASPSKINVKQCFGEDGRDWDLTLCSHYPIMLIDLHSLILFCLFSVGREKGPFPVSLI